MEHLASCLPCVGLIVAALLAAGWAAPAPAAVSPTSPDAVNERIQKCRTADVTLTVTGADGKPLAGAAVTVRQERHKFLFGSNAFAIKPGDAGKAQQDYRDRYAALLNYATLPFYWGAFERQEGRPGTDRVRGMAEWCAQNHIRAKGHPLCWHEVQPQWLDAKTIDEVKSLQLGRITRDVTAFAGLIDTWDVVNEAVRMNDYNPDTNRIAQLCRKLGRVGLIKETFASARAANAKATLILNDFDTSAGYEALIKDCLAAGVTIDVIGIQSHMHGGYWGAGKAWEVCERFARFGKPIHFTETTIASGDARQNINWSGRYTDWVTTPEGEKRQAREVAEFYRVLFSHPAVAGITWWDFSDAEAWLGAPSGLVRKDMSPKPAYDALMAMVKKEWWTATLELKADAAGKVKFHAFLGQYAVESGAARGTLDVSAAGEAALAVKLATEAAKK